jgi:hypothetical protein
MNWIKPFLTELKGVIKTVWPDVTTLHRVTQIQRTHWLNQVEKGKITLPFGVIQIGPVSKIGEWGAGNTVLRPEVSVYYVMYQEGANLTDVVDDRLMEFQKYLLEHSFATFQIPDDTEISFDSSESNVVNQLFLENNLQYFGCSFSFNPLVGYTVL